MRNLHVRLGRGLTLASFVTMPIWATRAAAQPVNDVCSAALPINDGSTAISTVGASTDGPSPCGSIGSDIWYLHTPTCTGNLTLSTCNTATYDTAIAVYPSGTCPPVSGSQLGCNDDTSGCGLSTILTVSVSAGVQVLIQMGGFAGNTGTGTLTLECLPPQAGACCRADVCTPELQTDCEADGGVFMGEGASCEPTPCSASNGPDVVYTEIGSISNYGAVGGIRGYALGSWTCNIGNQDLLWNNNGTPGLGMNAYRLHGGRLEQIGISWVKTACCVANGSCGGSCSSGAPGTLHPGCRDIYSSGWNGSQSRMGPRSGINPYSGDFAPIPGGSGNAIFRRLQVAETDLTQAGALYFVEGVYVGTDDAQAGNSLNNASYKRVTVGGDFSLNQTGSMALHVPAIFAWQDNDATVTTVDTDVPGEGRFIVAAKAEDNGDGTWRYTYAAYNLNSHRSGGSFSVPIPAGTLVTNAGFNDVEYHSGEPYDNTDWPVVTGATAVTWSSPETFAQNPDSNALRWGTMYTFWFDANVDPGTGEVTLGLFRPGTPNSVSAIVAVPSGAGGCVPDEVPEQTCDDGADNDCDGATDCGDPDCTADPACAAGEIPTVSEWGVMGMTLLLLTAGTIVFRGRRCAEA